MVDAQVRGWSGPPPAGALRIAATRSCAAVPLIRRDASSPAVPGVRTYSQIAIAATFWGSGMAAPLGSANVSACARELVSQPSVVVRTWRAEAATAPPSVGSSGGDRMVIWTLPTVVRLSRSRGAPSGRPCARNRPGRCVPGPASRRAATARTARRRRREADRWAPACGNSRSPGPRAPAGPP